MNTALKMVWTLNGTEAIIGNVSSASIHTFWKKKILNASSHYKENGIIDFIYVLYNMEMVYCSNILFFIIHLVRSALFEYFLSSFKHF